MKYILKLIKFFIKQYNLPVSTTNIKKILVVDLNHLGDMLMSSPVYRALKENIPFAKVDALVYSFTKIGLTKNSYIDKIYEFPKNSFFKQINIIFQCRRQNYDLVLQLNTSLRINFILYLIGKKYRLGYDYSNRGCFNNMRVHIKTRTARTRYRVDECLDLLEKAFGWKIPNRVMIFPVSEDEKMKVKKLLNEHGVGENEIIIGIHPHFRRTWKNEPEWPPEKFSLLIDKIIEKYNVKFLITGTNEDSNYISSIINATSHKNRIVSLVSKLSFEEMGALLQLVKIFITVNTSPMHIAISQNTPTIALMRATPPFITFPMNNPRFQYLVGKSDKAYNPNKLDYEYGSMIHKIEIDDVISKFDFLIKFLNIKLVNN